MLLRTLPERLKVCEDGKHADADRGSISHIETPSGRQADARCIDALCEAAGTLFAELDLLDRREVFYVDAVGGVWLVPVDFCQRDIAAKSIKAVTLPRANEASLMHFPVLRWSYGENAVHLSIGSV
jgi:hypothetical protein